ncbi:MAG: motility associated factor glycosyltransferase family protein, partial [Phycisphaerales bacterium]|nr:motility associated factor glycosyltransferase family protein [Phycisphaerales bacterium]
MPPVPRPDARTLSRNLEAIRRGSPGAVRAIEAAESRADVEFVMTDDGVVSASIGPGASARALASRRRPLLEAAKLAEPVDVRQKGCIVVVGFGVGHHVRALAEKMGRSGLVVVFEPDAALLRAVLERVDHSGWLGAANVAVMTDVEDHAAMATAVQGLEAIVAMGVELVEHPPSRERLGGSGGKFFTNFVGLVDNINLTVRTTLLQVRTTIRNQTGNLRAYTTGKGIAELRGSAAGKPGIVVAAGPSLRRNVELLRAPWVRERCVVIAVQTVLKTLLALGIRPHYVTALDYSEISTRFYEGLREEDVRGVELVVQPMGSPAILEAFPGTVRCAADSYLEELLGPGFGGAKEKGVLAPGATVAHLAYYLARYLGCDPVALVGQDLGFTDGQYYAAGASIHQVWAGELNPLRTLEMLEWERIKRAGRGLRKSVDVLGRAIYTDEQMHTYLMQFQRDFGADVGRGLRVIDCTEGGVAKQHTVAMGLGEFLEEVREKKEEVEREGSEEREVPGGQREERIGIGEERAGADAAERLARVRERVRRVRAEVGEIVELSERGAGLVREMLEHHEDQGRVNRLIGKVDELSARALSLEPAFGLSQRLNQAGSFNRVRADRSLGLEQNLTPMQRQRRQLERDEANLRSLETAAAALGEILDAATERLERPAPWWSKAGLGAG